MRKKKGDLFSFSIAFFSIVIIAVFGMYKYAVLKMEAESDMVHNAMAMSNLAVFKNIDLKMLGTDKKTIILKDPIQSLEVYKDKIKKNLTLDNYFKPVNPISFITSEVKIEKFIIYNVQGNDVTVYDVNPSNGTYTTNVITNGKGSVQTPRGNIVNETTIHSQLNFKINKNFGDDEEVNPTEDSDITNKG